MRLIGTVEEEKAARRFGDYLYSQGIGNDVKPGERWEIWVHSDDELDHAKALLDDFLHNPGAAGFREAEQIAQAKRKKEAEDLKAFRKQYFTPQQIFPDYGRMGQLTTVLIAICILVAILSHLGSNFAVVRHLLITALPVPGLIEVTHGQVWRLITPAFLHFGILHILFNMLWLRDLGSMIENRQGTWVLAGLFLLIALFSNYAQYKMGGPFFGGMSGVVYGLLGYAWIRGKFDPASGLFVHQQTVTMMIIWFFLCLSGLLGNVANTAHGVGLVVGMLSGFLSAKNATGWK